MRAARVRERTEIEAALAGGLDQGAWCLPDAACAKLADFVLLLGRWNRTFNLTGVRDPLDMVTRHLFDCLSVLPWVRGGRLLDVGTGAGLPGLVLAIARPALRCVLLDSNGKKTRFCLQAAAELGIENVQVVRERCERYRCETGFETVIARAVMPLGDFVAIAQPFLAPEGRMLAMRGADPRAALEALAPTGGDARVVSLDVPGLGEPRHLVIIENPGGSG